MQLLFGKSWMPSLRRLGAFAVVVGLGWGSLSAQDAGPGTEAITTRMKADIYFLAGPECEGRGVETQGILKAGDYIAKVFQDAGLKPGMTDGSYFQPFKITARPKLGNDNKVVVQHPKKDVQQKLSQDDFSVTSLSAPADLTKLAVVFAGYGITTTDGSYNDYKDLNVAGKAVVVIRRTPRYGQDNDPHKELASLASKAEYAEKNKAACIILVNDKENGKDGDALIPFGNNTGEGSPVVPYIHIKRSVLEEWLKPFGKTLKELEEGIAKDLKPMSFPLEGCTVDVKTDVQRKEIAARNVIGVLEGAGPLANETVIVGGHYDHLGLGEVGSLARGDDRKKTHFGADDNASGTTGVLELARRFGAIKNRQGRRLVFMTFSGEERGLLGSVHYCKNPVFPLDKTAAMVNMDMIGRLNNEANATRNLLEIGGVGTAKEFKPLIEKLNETFKFPIRTIDTGNGPSDHMSFNQKNVPVFFFFTGLHNEYHRPSDTPDLINVDGMRRIVDMVEKLTTELTGMPKPAFIKVAGSFSPGSGAPRVSIGLMPGSGAYDEASQNGVPVGGTRKDSPAEKAGLKEGDIITAVAGKPVKNINAYMELMAKQKPGETISFTVKRGMETLELKVEIPALKK